jgi:hypothetical protein
MEPHMIEIKLFSYLFVFGINHVGFIILSKLVITSDYAWRFLI